MWRRERWIATLLTMPATRSSALRRAFVVLAAALLAGCTAEAASEPAATTAATPAASPSPSPTAAATSEPTIEKITTPPRVPADLTTPGKVGSKAAVEYYVALYGYTLNTGDTSLLRAASTSTCEFCETYAAGTEAFHADGSTAAGGDASVKFMKLHEQESSENRHLWIVELALSARRSTTATGEVEDEAARVETTAIMAVWTGDSWKIGKHFAVNIEDAPDS